MAEPNGILSDSDKRYLASLDGPDSDEAWDGDEAQKRFRMRKKIQAALLDFPGISGLPRKEYELIFKDLRNVQSGPLKKVEDKKTGDMITVDWEADQYEALKHMLLFVYDACQLEPVIDFETLLERAIRAAENTWLENHDPEADRSTLRPKFVDDVTATIDITYHEQPNVQDIKAKLERDENLSRAEIGELYLKGELDGLELSPSDLDQQIRTREHHPDGFPGLDDPVDNTTYGFEQFTEESEKKRRRGESDETAQVTEWQQEYDPDDEDRPENQ